MNPNVTEYKDELHHKNIFINSQQQQNNWNIPDMAKEPQLIDEPQQQPQDQSGNVWWASHLA